VDAVASPIILRDTACTEWPLKGE